MPASLHGFNGPEVVSRFAELAGLWQAVPQNAKKKTTPASALRLAWQKQRRPDILFPEVPWEPAWLTPKIEDSALLINTLRHAAVGINVASTISLELCMFDKPVINVAYNPSGVSLDEVNYARYYEFDHYQPVAQSGAVMLAGSESELAEMLRRALNAPEADSLVRANLVRSMFGKLLDGGSGLRIARQLVSIAYRHESIASSQPVLSKSS